jgi:hypothetical protein
LGSASVIATLGLAGCADDSSTATRLDSEADEVPETSCDRRLVAFFTTETTDSALEASAARIASLAGVVTVDVVGQAESLARVRDLFSDDDQMLALLEARGVPSSIWIEVNDRTARDRVAAQVEEFDRVESVRTGSLAAPVPDSLDPATIDRWCEGESSVSLPPWSEMLDTIR